MKKAAGKVKVKSQAVKGGMPQFFDASSKKPEPDNKARTAPKKTSRQKLLGVRL